MRGVTFTNIATSANERRRYREHQQTALPQQENDD